MKENKIKNLYLSISFLFIFIIFTFSVCRFDLKAIGPNNSVVGYSTINYFVHNIFGTNITLYNITDWLGLVPIFFALCFALLGLVQWIKRKNIFKVDFSILILGFHYLITVLAYFFFEYYVINYRPVLINGYLEASYPSSTTLLVLCIMPTVVIQIDLRLKSSKVKNICKFLIYSFTAFMIIGRIISGVHWITDIIGSLLLSLSFIYLYIFFCSLKK